MENETTFAPVVGRWVVIEQLEYNKKFYVTLREDLTEDELSEFRSIFGIAAEGVSEATDTLWITDRIAKFCVHDATFCEILEGEVFSPDPDGFIGVGDYVGGEDSLEREFLFEVELRESNHSYYFLAKLLRYGRTELSMVDDFHRF